MFPGHLLKLTERMLLNNALSTGKGPEEQMADKAGGSMQRDQSLGGEEARTTILP